MKKFILNTLLFLLFTIVFYIGALFFWGRYAADQVKSNLNYRLGAKGHSYLRLKEAEKTQGIDILFLGSSHAYRGFDPRIFLQHNWKTFNLGTSAQTPIQAEILLKRYFDHLQAKTVIYEVFPRSFWIDGVESSVDLISNDENDFLSLKMAFKINNIITYNTLIYASLREAFNLNQDFYQSEILEDERYVKGGYVEKNMSHYRPTPLNSKTITIDSSQLKSFRNILQYLHAQNCKVILVYAPISNQKYQSYTQKHFFDSLMSTYAAYYNFNEIMHLDDSLHFYDSHHLNQQGVNLFNQKLIETLKEEISIP